MLPPWPPSPPEGPPRGTYFSRRKAMQPLPPSPPFTNILASSTNTGRRLPRRIAPEIKNAVQQSRTAEAFAISVGRDLLFGAFGFLSRLHAHLNCHPDPEAAVPRGLRRRDLLFLFGIRVNSRRKGLPNSALEGQPLF